MKPFFIKILTFFLLYLLVSVVISAFTPYHWGNPWYSTKIQFLEQDSDTEHNTFFLGSSRIYRQIDPNIFDHTFNSLSQEKISSFNLGAPATFTPQSYYLYENFLKSDLAKNVKYCFLELMEVDLLTDYFLHQERTTYWQNFSDILFVEKSILNNNGLKIEQKIKSTINYTISYFENIFHLGHFGQHLLKRKYYDEKYLGPYNNGFYPLQFEYNTTTDPIVKEDLLDRKNTIINNPKLIDNRRTHILSFYKNISNIYDSVHLRRIEELINKSKEKGILLIFILSPRNVGQELINLSRQISKTNLIDMANPQIYNELYEYDNSFDIGHLNEKGSTKYSQLIAIEFEKRIHERKKNTLSRL